jgi:hypothetical protein
MRLFCACLLLMVTACATQPAYADSLSVITGAWSDHMSNREYIDDNDVRRKYNQTHESIGLKFSMREEKAKTSHNLFAFSNSYENRGVAYLYSSQKCDGIEAFTLCAGWAAGLTTGYEKTHSVPLLPYAGFAGTLEVYIFELDVMYVPFANLATYQLSTEVLKW